MRGLAFRRHQRARARGRALRYVRWLLGPAFATARQVARYAADRTPCSCWMCGNPRRYTGEVTPQELKFGCGRAGRAGEGES